MPLWLISFAAVTLADESLPGDGIREDLGFQDLDRGACPDQRVLPDVNALVPPDARKRSIRHFPPTTLRANFSMRVRGSMEHKPSVKQPQGARAASSRWRRPPESLYGTAVDAWRVRDVSSWTEGLREPRGMRAKVWVQDPDGVFWLRKSHRVRSPYEPAIECLALRLALASGLPAASADACTWREGSVIRRGIIVRRFLEQGDELHSGDQILAGADSTYRSADRPAHTVGRVLAALRGLDPQLVPPFLRMLAFDAVIGNGDRHQGNWSVIRTTTGAFRLAPLYDPAGCLGAELHVGHRVLQDGPSAARIAAYAQGCPSGFGDGARLLKLREVVDELRSQQGWPEAVSVVRDGVRQAMPALLAYLQTVPEEWYPTGLQRLARSILAHRLDPR